MPHPPLNLDRTWNWAVGSLVFAVLVFEITNIDLWIQDRLFDFATGTWLVNGREPVARWIFYTGPKIALILLGVVLLAALARPSRDRVPTSLRSRARVFVVLLSLALTPALIGWGKAATNVFCPSEIERYGGNVPYVRVFESHPPERPPARRGRCFPAGHASGGFALFALAGLATHRRGQLTAIAAGCGVGSIMGFYQMAKGAHYLSHTVITALVAWLVFVGLHMLARFATASPEGGVRVRLLNSPDTP